MKKFTATILFIILILIIYSTAKMGYRRYLLRQETKALQSQISEIESKNEELSDFIRLYKSKTFREQEAREKFNLKKPGENVVLIFSEDKNDKKKNKNGNVALLDNSSPETPKTIKSNPKKWIEFLLYK